MPHIEQFFAHRRYLGNLVTDGQWVYYITDTSGQFNIWKIPCQGGYARQLTDFHDASVRQLTLSPNGTDLYFLADAQGDEAFGIYSLATPSGWPQEVSIAPQVRHEMHPDGISPDGRYLVFTANDRNPADRDVVLMDRLNRTCRRLIEDGQYWQPGGWSPDGGAILLSQVLSNSHNRLFWANLSDGSLQLLTSAPTAAVYQPIAFAADGKGIFVLTNQGRDYVGLALLSDHGRDLTWLVTPEWDVEGALSLAAGNLLVWSVNENGFSRLYRGLWDGHQLAKVQRLRGWPDGIVPDMVASPDGKVLFGYVNRSEHPTEIYALELDGGQAVPLTDGTFGGLEDSDQVVPAVVTYGASDGLEISGLFYRPHQSGPYPALLMIHGGPEAQERPLYIGFYQYLLSKGIALFAPNFRGSTGYGKTFQKRIYHDWGGAELDDLVRAQEWLAQHPDVDANRLGVFGASYGGFATLSLISRYPQRWRAAAEVVGPTNLLTFVQRVPPSWKRFMAELIGDPESEAEFLRARSPMTYVDQVRCPLLVIQGGKDPRVNRSESEQWVEALQQRGVPVEYRVFEDEGHGFTKRENQLSAWGTVAEFLLEHLSSPTE